MNGVFLKVMITSADNDLLLGFLWEHHLLHMSCTAFHRYTTRIPPYHLIVNMNLGSVDRSRQYCTQLYTLGTKMTILVRHETWT